MECPDISMLIFSHSSEAAIKEINRIQGLGNLLASVMAGSVLLEIFTGYHMQVQGTAHKIVQKDWKLWAQAMRAVPNIVSRRIYLIAFEQTQKSTATDERQFWTAVMEGCH